MKTESPPDLFLSDIPHDLAERAHANTSFSPERRADQERADYVNTLTADFTELSKLADTDEKRVLLASEFARYREGLKTRTIAMLAAKSRCFSSMITGESNFNTRRAGKASDTADKRATDLLEFRERAMKAIRKVLTPELAPIMTGDADAGERLADKIKTLEEKQAQYKAVNALIRKHAKGNMTERIEALLAAGISAGTASKLITPDVFGNVGIPGYELTNLSANIRRLKARVETVTADQAEPTVMIEGSAARFEDAPADNRVRLYFHGKPDEATRMRLKASGFRWTPTLGAWQAHRNHGSITIARREAEAVAP